MRLARGDSEIEEVANRDCTFALAALFIFVVGYLNRDYFNPFNSEDLCLATMKSDYQTMLHLLQNGADPNYWSAPIVEDILR